MIESRNMDARSGDPFEDQKKAVLRYISLNARRIDYGHALREREWRKVWGLPVLHTIYRECKYTSSGCCRWRRRRPRMERCLQLRSILNYFLPTLPFSPLQYVVVSVYLSLSLCLFPILLSFNSLDHFFRADPSILQYSGQSADLK